MDFLFLKGLCLDSVSFFGVFVAVLSVWQDCFCFLKGGDFMKKLFYGAKVYIAKSNSFEYADILLDDNIVSSVFLSSADRDFLAVHEKVEADFYINCNGMHIFPGFTDVHVHFREPGFSSKETIESGSAAAAHGGYTRVCTMPNLSPAPECIGTLREQQKLLKKSSVRVYPYGTITKERAGNEISDMMTMSRYVVGFSDDGSGVQSRDVMREAMVRAASLGKIIAAHCEDNSLLNGGCINECDFAVMNGFRGISSMSEWVQIKRDIEIMRDLRDNGIKNVKYHVCHISTKESVELIRCAKKDGLDISCETAPHYLVLDDSFLVDDGRFKMNPPLRSCADRKALIDGIVDGTIDMIATDHAPHTTKDKSGGLKKSAMGIVGLETAFPVLYTELVKTGIIKLEKLINLMSVLPVKRFELDRFVDCGDGIYRYDASNNNERDTRLEPIGYGTDLTIFDLNESYVIEPKNFLSLGHSTPFEGMQVFGKCLMTVCNGESVYVSDKFVPMIEKR